MPVPQEVDDLERLVTSLVQEIGRRKASLVTTQIRIDSARENLSRCKLFSQICKENLDKLRKSDLVSLDEFKRLTKLYHDNVDLIYKYGVELSNRFREKENAESEIPVLESSLRQAQQKLSRWGVVVPFKK